MRLAAYQFAVCGDIDHNLEIIKKAIVSASENKVDLIIFPECALTGYPPRDIAGQTESMSMRFRKLYRSYRNWQMNWIFTL
ncbi:MAG: hypothetical protein E7301_06205 [Butyrivibrio sp.]|nr:hypothetical protein [Butyrivibrio sp.]